MKIGYARVSTHEQTLDLQIDQLQTAGCDPDHIHADQVSGSRPGLERPGLAAALAYARAGDQLVIWRLDRLGRSLKDLIEQVANLERHGIELVSLQESIDTLTPAGKALFQICGVFAEFERNLISERTKAGLTAARARGRKGGRKPKLTPEQLDRAAGLMRARQLTVREIARLSGVTPNTLYRYLTPDGEPRAGAPTLAEP
ncbi:MAG: recombinase family protein [Caldilineaceae bacterium]|nr:recombinase family protein [Caldilineaceae bacterium]